MGWRLVVAGERRGLLVSGGKGERRRHLFTVKLQTPHPLQRLFPLNLVLFAGLQDLFVFDPQFPPLDIVPVQRGNHTRCFVWRAEICKRQSAEDTVVVVVVECVGERRAKGLHHAQQCLAGDGEWNVLDHDGGRDDIVVLRGDGGHGVAVPPPVGGVGRLRVLAGNGVGAREADGRVADGGRGGADDVHGRGEGAVGVGLVRVRLAGVGGGGGGGEGGGRGGDVGAVLVGVVPVLGLSAWSGGGGGAHIRQATGAALVRGGPVWAGGGGGAEHGVVAVGGRVGGRGDGERLEAEEGGGVRVHGGGRYSWRGSLAGEARSRQRENKH